MKKFKFSFALVIAVAAVAFTFATKANTLGKKEITACFTTLDVRASISGSISTLSDALDAGDAVTLKSQKPYIVSADVTIPVAQCPDTDIFCCAKVVETTNIAAAEINLGEGPKRYAVGELFFKD